MNDHYHNTKIQNMEGEVTKVKQNALWIFSLLLILSSFLSCAPKISPAKPEVVKREKAPVETNTQRPAWEVEWEHAMSLTKKEGKVNIYVASVAGALEETLPSFEKKYGFTFNIVTGRTSQVAAKLLQERASGLFIADVFIGGLNTFFGAVKKPGNFQALDSILILPEVVDAKLWYGGQLPWADADHQVFSFYAYPSPMTGINTDLVRQDEIKSYYDLLDTKWKGKILLNDPTVPGTAFNGFSTMLYHKLVDRDFFRQLVSQQTQVLRDERLLVDWLARGKYPIALWPLSSPMAEYQKAGAPVNEIEEKEGTYLSQAGGNIGLLSKAPHPNAAKVFINWLLSREGQTMIQKYFLQQSARVDLTTDGLDPLRTRKPGHKYFIGANSIEEWVNKEQDKYLNTAKDIFGPLMK